MTKTKIIREPIGFFYSKKYNARIPLFRNLEVSTKIKQEEMDKHINGRMTQKNGGINKYGKPAKSYWRNDLTENQINDIVISSIGKGKVFRLRDGSYRELIKYGDNVGKYIDSSNGRLITTQRFMIHYSKDGVHAYPCHPKREV